MKEIQQMMANRIPGPLGMRNVQQYAVFLPLVQKDGAWQVLFQERAYHLRRQPGEICFPGGRIESDDRSAEEAAIRETYEELGLAEGDLECFGPLDYLVEPHRIVYPFAGRIVNEGNIRPNRDEVESIFYVPLEQLKRMKPDIHTADLYVHPKDDFPFDKTPNDRERPWQRGELELYFYTYENYTIWGLTARILYHFLELVQEQP